MELYAFYHKLVTKELELELVSVMKCSMNAKLR